MARNPQPDAQIGPWYTVRYDKAVEECQPFELFDMENARLGAALQIETRAGIAAYASESALGGSPTETMLAQFDSDATTTHIVRVSGAVIYKYSSSDWNVITGGVTVTAGDDNTWEWVDANGTLVATNGVDTDAWKWAGSGNATALDDDARFSKGKHAAWFNNRLWIGNVDGASGQLWYSDIAAIETWGATSFINFGGIIRAIEPMHNQLVVHTTDGIYTVTPTGNAVNPYIITQRTGKREASPLAATSGRGVVTIPGGHQLVILEDGIYQWSGGEELEKISGALDNRYWSNVNVARLGQAFAGRFPLENEVWFSLPHGDSQANMNHVMVYNHRRPWVDEFGQARGGGWHGPYKGFERNCYALINRKPHLGDLAGQVWDHDSATYSDNTSAIASYFETGAIAPGGVDVDVRWQHARHYYDGVGDWNAAIQQRAADLEGLAETIQLRSGTFTLGTSVLGGSDTLQAVRQQTQDVPCAGYGPYSSFKVSTNAANQHFAWRKILPRVRVIGRQLKPKPSDS